MTGSLINVSKVIFVYSAYRNRRARVDSTNLKLGKPGGSSFGAQSKENQGSASTEGPSLAELITILNKAPDAGRNSPVSEATLIPSAINNITSNNDNDGPPVNTPSPPSPSLTETYLQDLAKSSPFTTSHEVDSPPSFESVEQMSLVADPVSPSAVDPVG